MAELSHLMTTALAAVKPFDDEELRRRALALVALPPPRPAPMSGQPGKNRQPGYDPAEAADYRDSIEIATTIWRLLDRLDEPRDASGRTARENLQAAVDFLVDDLLRPLGGVADGAALTVPQLMLLMDDLKAHVLELRAEKATAEETIAGYRQALGNVTDSPPHSGTKTSKAAARSIAPIVNEMRLKLLATLERMEDGDTADGIEKRIKMAGNSIRPRLVEMETLGWVKRDGDTRKTRSGRDASVWRITETGEEAFVKAAHEAANAPS